MRYMRSQIVEEIPLPDVGWNPFLTLKGVMQRNVDLEESSEAAVEVPPGSDRWSAYGVNVLVSELCTTDDDEGAGGPADGEATSAGPRAVR